MRTLAVAAGLVVAYMVSLAIAMVFDAIYHRRTEPGS